ncbi:UDP-N-acetylglucosamine--N-acetylmuramyl-(pentapeptide) pyrophosphoryl-undecaprenol N-acetylglucosamine transferase [Austwickia sp. TVS 96-490-7B]|uniref:UDP-N-acetylglucosamine transferase subunit ALG14 n=1 Tax=Austwickia sp. TVS 96-490-7B TaxID=2830843 RepID=UPI001D25C0AC|nr:UDP-N-acetylglucosamine transferase subunit ALG14 [Austwickia sp. TVS 96-490-7B]MBW3085258.1 UDP-N-acetylglucosamine--N-acetylmuramyl-(pentapeptide) pyrophosphoryl-undecaprenol N-acetylglucosamine transferase [Austwickia sp. TVS 96-490-7B]
MLIASTGGHLAQLHAVRRHWVDTDVQWVTFPQADARTRCEGDQVIWAHFPTTRHLPNAIRNLRLALRTLRRDRPDVIVSDGAGVAVPFFFAARLFRIPTVYLEVFDRVSSPTLTGRLCYPITDQFLLQWEQQQASYPEGAVVGRVY